MRTINTFLFFKLFFLSSFLFSQGIVSVQKVGEIPLKSAEGLFVYSLPRTTLAIKVVTKRTNIYSGPYFAYAEEFLGIKGAPKENSIEWKIDSINIIPLSEPDPDEMYALKTEKGFDYKSLFDLTKAGIILNPSIPALDLPNPVVIPKNPETVPDFREMSMQGFYSESADTFYKTIIKDSLSIKVPVIKPKTVSKSIKEKAHEAANVIMKIRQRRFEMILAEDETLPDVEVFKADLDMMKKIEEDYLDLFIGRRTTEFHVSWFSYTPVAITRESQFEIFRFSTKSGISDRTVSSATPVFLTFEKDGRSKGLNEWLQNAIPPIKNHLFYRIPDAAVVNAIWKGDLLTSKKVLIYQFGAIVPFPVYENK